MTISITSFDSRYAPVESANGSNGTSKTTTIFSTTTARQVNCYGGKNLFGRYIEEISVMPFLTDEQIIEQFKLIEEAKKQHDKQAERKAKRILIESNLKLVVSVAKKFFYVSLPLLDRIQAGNIGLIKAVDDFDYNLGYKFSTFASKRIYGSVKRTIDNQARTTRIPVYMISAINKISKVTCEYGDDLTAEEISELSGIDQQTIEGLPNIASKAVSFDQTFLDGDTELWEIINPTDEQTPGDKEEEILKNARNEQKVNFLLRRLHGREKKIVTMYFGLDDGVEKSFAEIGKRLSLDPRRVRHILDKSLKIMCTNPNSSNFSYSRRTLRSKLKKNLQHVNENQQLVLRLYFGLDGGDELTLSEIGKRINISRQRAGQIKDKALEIMVDKDKSLRRYMPRKKTQGFSLKPTKPTKYRKMKRIKQRGT